MAARQVEVEGPRFYARVAFARVATALAFTSVSALAVGGLAVGALAHPEGTRRLAVARGRIGHLAIDEPAVGRLRVGELIVERQA
jgi:hypothetical protein